MSYYSAAVTIDGAIRYYRLGESSGTAAQDNGSQAVNGTYNNGPALGQRGLIYADPNTAVTFAAASSQSVTAATTGLPSGAAAWTMEAWVKLSSNTSGAIMHIGNTTSGQGAELAYDATNTRFYVNTFGAATVVGPSTVTVGKIYSLVATYTGSLLTLYINNANAASATVTLNITYGTFSIGNGSSAFDGIIDEAAVYSFAFTTTESHWRLGSAGGPPPTGAYYSLVMRYNPAAYWPMNDPAGTTAALDATGSSLDVWKQAGTITFGQPSLQSGSPSSTSAQFDGTASYLLRSTTPLTSTTGNNTMAAWIKPTTVPQAGCVVQIGGSSGGYGFEIDNSAGGSGALITQFSRGVGFINSGFSVTAGTTYFVVVTDDGTSVRFYINGSLFSTLGRQGVNAINQQVSIGAFTNGAFSRFFAGNIAHVSLHGSVLTADQIKRLYQAGISAGIPEGRPRMLARMPW